MKLTIQHIATPMKTIPSALVLCINKKEIFSYFYPNPPLCSLCFFYCSSQIYCNEIDATLSLNNFSASVHTLAVYRSFNWRSVGIKSLLNASEASRGRRVGRWSIEMTESAGGPLSQRNQLHVYI